MRVKLKRVTEQVIVITGASSGIGLATALMAGRHGARRCSTPETNWTWSRQSTEFGSMELRPFRWSEMWRSLP